MPERGGALLVDKPAGRTSHDVVDYARKRFGTRRVGHLGTLDPQATGVLPLAVREATKLVPFLQTMQKAYVGTVRFGSEYAHARRTDIRLQYTEGVIRSA